MGGHQLTMHKLRDAAGISDIARSGEGAAEGGGGGGSEAPRLSGRRTRQAPFRD